MYGEAPGSAKVEKVIIYSIAMGLCPENNQAMGSRILGLQAKGDNVFSSSGRQDSGKGRGLENQFYMNTFLCLL